MTRPAWQALAACRDVDTNIFFPDTDAGHSFDYGPAKAICARCVVQPICLDENIRERHGCWGGTSPSERSKLARQRADTVACAGCGVELARTRQGQRQPWCPDEACQREAWRRRTEAWRRRTNEATAEFAVVEAVPCTGCGECEAS